MDFNNFKSYFVFNRNQRTGIFCLFVLIIAFQIGYYCIDFSINNKISKEKEQWISVQHQIDSLKQLRFSFVPKLYPFNPNFITDFKGYKLGMSLAEIDRLLAYRKQNKYVNSPKEFQTVTKVSDSLLNAISPYFKFPDWVNNKKEFKNFKEYPKSAFAKKEKIIAIDINLATKEDLIKIYGIGEAISIRILKFRETLGGFVSMEQMKDVWGLSPEVIENLNSHFKISKSQNLKKIDINNASIKELSQFPYFNYQVAKQIVTFRSMNGDFKNVDDLTKIKGLSIDKANIIALYLVF